MFRAIWQRLWRGDPARKEKPPRLRKELEPPDLGSGWLSGPLSRGELLAILGFTASVFSLGLTVGYLLAA